MMRELVSELPSKGAALLGAFLAGLLMTAILQVNALTAQVYHMGDLEQRLEQIKERGLVLEAQHLAILSRSQMEELAQELRLQRVQNVSYLRVLGSSVAATTNSE